MTMIILELVFLIFLRKSMKTERLAMQERLQKKYRPQMPRPLATGEIEKIDLVDITQPPTDPEPSVNSNSNMSRAQQLVKKSHIVTAQQKVKVSYSKFFFFFFFFSCHLLQKV